MDKQFQPIPTPLQPQPQLSPQPSPLPQPQPQLQTNPLSPQPGLLQSQAQSQPQPQPLQPQQSPQPQYQPPAPQSKAPSRTRPIIISIAAAILLAAAGFAAWFFLLRPDYSRLSATLRTNFWSAKKLQIGGSLTFDLPRPSDRDYYIKQIKTVPRILMSSTAGESYVNFSVGLVGSDNAAYSFALNLRPTSSDVVELTLVDPHAVIPLLEKLKPTELLNLNRRTSIPLTKWAEKYNRVPLKIDLAALNNDNSGFANDFKSLLCGFNRLGNLHSKKAELANIYNDDPFLALDKPLSSQPTNSKTTDFAFKIKSDALAKFGTPLSGSCNDAPSKSIRSIIKMLDLGSLLPAIFSGNAVATVSSSQNRLIKYAASRGNVKQELTFIYDRFNLPERTTPSSDWWPDLIQAYKNYQALAASSDGDLIDDYIPLDKNCSVFQGVDPTDRCYKPGCGSSIDRNPNPACLPQKR